MSGSMLKIETIVFVITLIGVMYIFAPIKYFVWHALPVSPEPIEKIVSANHLGDVVIKTNLDRIFVCNIYEEDACWHEIKKIPLDLSTPICFLNECTDDHIVQIVQATIQFHSFGHLTTIFSLNDNGIVYTRQTGFVDIGGLVLGGILGGIFAIGTFVIKRISLAVTEFFRSR
jgi:hypothetical protein